MRAEKQTLMSELGDDRARYVKRRKGLMLFLI